MTPLGTRSKYELATTSRGERHRRARARRKSARQSARALIAREVIP